MSSAMTAGQKGHHVELINYDAAQEAHAVLLQKPRDDLVGFFNGAHHYPSALRV